MNHFETKMVKANLLKRKKKSLLMILTMMISTMIMFSSISIFLMIQSIDHNKEQWDYHYMIKAGENRIETSYKGYQETIEATTNHYLKDNNQLFALHYLSPFAHFGYYDDDNYEVYLQYLFAIQGDIRDYFKQDVGNVVAVSIHSGYQLGDIIDFEVLQRSNDDGQKNKFNEVIDLNVGQYETVETKQYIVAALYVPTKELEEVTGGLEYVYTLDQTNNKEYYHFIKYDTAVIPTIDELATDLQINISDIYSNQTMINEQHIDHLMSQSKSLIYVFGFIFIITIIAVSTTLKNILLIGEAERKIQFGILKSIGTKNKTIKKIMQIELFILSTIGSILGGICGIMVNRWIITIISTSQYGTMIQQNKYEFLVLLATIVLSIIITMLTGVRYHKKNFKTYPIEDFQKGYSYDSPVKMKSIRKHAVTWNLFFIYNTRIKKQTRNLFIAFLLLLVSGLIFATTFVFNMNTRDTLKDKASQYDITIASYNYTEGFFNEELVSSIYHYFETKYKDQENDGLKRLYMHRELSMMNITKDGQQSTSKFILYDDKQMKELCSLYQFEGKCDSLTQGEVIFAPQRNSYNEYVPILNDVLTLKCEIGGSYLDKGEITVVGILEHQSQIDKTPIYTLIQSKERYVTEYYIGHIDFIQNYADQYVSESFSSSNVISQLFIELENKATHTQVTKDIRKLMKDLKIDQDKYFIDDVLETIDQSAFGLFISEMITYPLFILLTIIFTLNILIATMAHIESKKQDLTLFKSIGTTNKQLRRIILYEYLEAYVNAAVITLITVITIVILSHFVFGEHFFFNIGSHIGLGWFISVSTLSLFIFILVVFNAYRFIHKVPAIKQETHG